MRLYHLIESSVIDLEYTHLAGHALGQCHYDAAANKSIIHVPKNASSDIKPMFAYNNWKEDNFYQRDCDEYIAILRDPTDRWVSGITEFLIGENSFFGQSNRKKINTVQQAEQFVESDIVVNLLTTEVMFDAHTMPQCLFLKGIPFEKLRSFSFRPSVLDEIGSYLGLKLLKKNNNSTATDPIKLAVSNGIRKLLSTNPILQKKLDHTYYCDHQLLDKVTTIN